MQTFCIGVRHGTVWWHSGQACFGGAARLAAFSLVTRGPGLSGKASWSQERTLWRTTCYGAVRQVLVWGCCAIVRLQLCACGAACGLGLSVLHMVLLYTFGWIFPAPFPHHFCISVASCACCCDAHRFMRCYLLPACPTCPMLHTQLTGPTCTLVRFCAGPYRLALLRGWEPGLVHSAVLACLCCAVVTMLCNYRVSPFRWTPRLHGDSRNLPMKIGYCLSIFSLIGRTPVALIHFIFHATIANVTSCSQCSLTGSMHGRMPAHYTRCPEN